MATGFSIGTRDSTFAGHFVNSGSWSRAWFGFGISPFRELDSPHHHFRWRLGRSELGNCPAARVDTNHHSRSWKLPSSPSLWRIPKRTRSGCSRSTGLGRGLLSGGWTLGTNRVVCHGTKTRPNSPSAASSSLHFPTCAGCPVGERILPRRRRTPNSFSIGR